MTDFTKSPTDISEAKRRLLLSNFGITDNVEKSIDKNEFTAKYGVGHDVFTLSDLNTFEKDVYSNDGDNETTREAIKNEFSGFTEVIVKGVDSPSGIEKVYVREAKAEEAAGEVEEK